MTGAGAPSSLHSGRALPARARAAIMRSIRSVDTRPELVVRRILTRLGYRYRLHRRELPGRPDIVFIGRRKALFVNGCFWHQHTSCKRATIPKSRRDYWVPKLRRNVERDEQSLEDLRRLKWEVLVLWECELRATDVLARRLSRFLGSPRKCCRPQSWAAD